MGRNTTRSGKFFRRNLISVRVRGLQQEAKLFPDEEDT